jgi:hypothetical protein
MHIILRGPSYGADIVWDEDSKEAGLVQGVWRERKPTRPQASRPYRGKNQSQTIPDDAPQVGATNGFEAGTQQPFTRASGSPAKLGDIGTTVHTPLSRRSPRRKDQDSNQALVTSKYFPPGVGAGSNCLDGLAIHQLPGLTPKFASPQAPAWQAGRLAAEIPSILERMIEEVEMTQFKVPQWLTQQDGCSNESYRAFSSTNPKSNPSPRAGVWNLTTRAEVDAFVGAYHTRRLAAHCRVAKLTAMRELQAKMRAEQSDQDNEVRGSGEECIERAVGGPARKRRRRV